MALWLARASHTPEASGAPRYLIKKLVKHCNSSKTDLVIMPRKKAAAKKTSSDKNGTGDLGFEAKLWLAADKLRNNMDAAEYKHVVLGLIFLKYISDAFDELHGKLAAGEDDYAGADPEDPDEYRAENVFWVPPEARWRQLQASAHQPTIGKLIDDAMVAIERDNARLKGVLPKDYARPALDKHRLGELIDLIGTIGLGDAANRSKDILGRVYEYFLSSFASAEGKKGGQFYTPRCVVALLVEMLAPRPGSRIYDPCCGSGGMFVQSEKFIEEHGGRIGDIAVYGQESNPTTRKLAAMNLAIRGIEADLGPEHADTFRRDLHPDLRADYVIANPPFNDSDWFRKDDDVRWQYGTPPGKTNPGQTLFIDARKLGSMIDRVHRELTEADIRKIADTYHAWKGEMGREKSEMDAEFLSSNLTFHYSDIPGFCKSARKDEIASHGYVLTPGRYVGAEAATDEGEPFEEKMPKLVAELEAHFAESARLEAAIRANLKELGYGG